MDGAVLAFVYFIIKALGAGRQVALFVSVPIVLLAALNWLHAELISRQSSWYSGIAERLQTLLGQDAISHKHSHGGLRPSGTHSAYQMIHIAIAVALLLLGAMMIGYGLGTGPELVLLTLKQ